MNVTEKHVANITGVSTSGSGPDLTSITMYPFVTATVLSWSD